MTPLSSAEKTHTTTPGNASPPAPTRRAGALRVAAFNLVLFLVLAEGVGLLAFYTQTGGFYYTGSSRHELVPERLGDAVAVVESYRLHPYFGYVLLPDLEPVPEDDGKKRKDRPQNNAGFDSDFDLPYARQRRAQFLVGIFGGSVASKLAVFENRQRILSRAIADQLGKRVQDVVVLNFAQGGFKQPQQLLIYSYYKALGQELDLAINVDGFNEIALGTLNAEAGISPAMPSLEHIGGLRLAVGRAASVQGLEDRLRIALAWRDYARIHNRTWSGAGWELRFASGFLADWILTELRHRQFERLSAGYVEMRRAASETDSWLFLSPADEAAPTAPGSADGTLKEILRIWAESSWTMQQIQTRSGGLYLHFVQPNQYSPGKRTFSDAEKAVALSDDSAYAGPIREGYPRLHRALVELRGRGVAAYDLTHLFDRTPGAVYADNCCHYTDHGQRLVAKAIARVAVKTLERRQAAKEPPQK